MKWVEGSEGGKYCDSDSELNPTSPPLWGRVEGRGWVGGGGRAYGLGAVNL